MSLQLEQACQQAQAHRVLHFLDPLRLIDMEGMQESAAPFFTEPVIDWVICGQLEESNITQALENAGYEVALGKKPAGSLKTAMVFLELITTCKISVVLIHTETSYERTLILGAGALFRLAVIFCLATEYRPRMLVKFLLRSISVDSNDGNYVDYALSNFKTENLQLCRGPQAIDSLDKRRVLAGHIGSTQKILRVFRFRALSPFAAT